MLGLQQAFENKGENALLNKKLGKTKTGSARHLQRIQLSLVKACLKVHRGKTNHKY